MVGMHWTFLRCVRVGVAGHLFLVTLCGRPWSSVMPLRILLPGAVAVSAGVE